MHTRNLMITATTLAVTLGGASLTEAADLGTLWPSDALTKVMRDAKPGGDLIGEVRIAGARGEIASGQAIFRSARDIDKASCRFSDLRHTTSDSIIPASAVSLQWVRYIDIDRNTAGLPEDELVARAPTSIPDPFWEPKTIAAKADMSQPVWIEIHIPRDAKPGDYEGELTVSSGDDSLRLRITLHVWSFDMPAERHLSVINWWQFPGAGFRKTVKAHSPKYWDLLARFCAFVVAHRQTDVLGHLSLITETGNETDGFNYDTSRLERFAEVAFDAGVQRVHLHSIGKRTGAILDPASRIVANEPSFRRLAVLEKLIRHRGWQNRFLVSIADEPFVHHEESYAAVVERAHQVTPSVRCIEAIETEYLGPLDIYVPKLSHLNLWYPRFDQVRRNGSELWFYTCCHPVGRYPNRFLDQSLLKVRVLHWINYLHDLDGYLHWGLNFFANDDCYTQEAISKDLPLGDRAIAYPGNAGLLGSLRFSAQRDGLQDYEYLWVLENKLRQIKERVGEDAFWLDPRQRSLELCRRVIWSFHDYTRDSSQLFDTRRAIAEEIESLSEPPLLIVQTSSPEGTTIPAGPRHVTVRGLVPPGAAVTVNGKPGHNVRPSGYFLHVHFMPDDEPTITVTVEHEGKTRTATRTFKLTD